MSNEAEVEFTEDGEEVDKVYDDMSPEAAERRQELADIKREELAEQDPNGFDVVNDGNTLSPPDVPEIIGDIDSLSLNEKYALVLHQVKQLGPLFFAQVSPETFKLPDRDPLNLIWINMLTSWLIASDILAKFEVAMLVEAAEETTTTEGDSTDGTNDTVEKEQLEVSEDTGETAEPGSDAAV